MSYVDDILTISLNFAIVKSQFNNHWQTTLFKKTMGEKL